MRSVPFSTIEAEIRRLIKSTGGAGGPFLPLSGGTVTGALTVSSGGITVTGNSTFNNNLTVSGTLLVTGAATFSSTINSQTISASASFTGTVSVVTSVTVTADSAPAFIFNPSGASVLSPAPRMHLAKSTAGKEILAQFSNSSGDNTANLVISSIAISNGNNQGTELGFIRSSTTAFFYNVQSGPVVIGSSNNDVTTGVVAKFINGAPGANKTSFYVNEGTGPTLRQMTTFDPGNLGVNFTAGQKVCVMV